MRRREAGWGDVITEACQTWFASVGSLGVPVNAWPEELCAIRSKWSLPTRLETRTKESYVHASVKVEKPSRVMKGKRCQAQAAASADHESLTKGLSMSVSARTRKMVNYACVG